MSHVMVPCPEEHVDELRAGLLGLSLGAAGWTDETLDVFLSGLDDLPLKLVVAVARPSADDGHVTFRAAAELLGVEAGDVLDLVTQINDSCHRRSFPLPLITGTKDVRGSDGVSSPAPVLTTIRLVATMILAWPGLPAATRHQPLRPK